MQTIAIMNRKGGVGKTTTALALADELMARGERVMLVDLDQQHNATTQYGARIEGVTTAYDLLTDISADAVGAVQETRNGLIVAGDDLMNGIEVDMSSLMSREYMLNDALVRIDDSHALDWCIIDCPPALGTVALNVLVASEWVVAPVQADEYSLEGWRGLSELVAKVEGSPRLNPNIRVAGILMTLYEPRQLLSRRKRAELEAEAGVPVFETGIRRCVKVREAQDACVPLREYAPSCTAAADYAEWVDELLSTIGRG